MLATLTRDEPISVPGNVQASNGIGVPKEELLFARGNVYLHQEVARCVSKPTLSIVLPAPFDVGASSHSKPYDFFESLDGVRLERMIRRFD